MKSPVRPRARFWRAAALSPAFAAGGLAAAEPVSPVAAPPTVTPALEKTVVVASRREEKVADVSPSVSVVSRDEVKVRQLGTLAETLNYSPGVIVATTGAPGGNQSVFTRGTNSNMTAVLLDGRRVSPGFSNGAEIERFSLSGVNSVEFMRGASSTLYGANALGGVIDMRTADTLNLRKNSGDLTAEFGSFGHSSVGVTASGNTDTAGDKALVRGLGAAVAFTRTETDNDRPNNDFSRDNLLQKFEYRISDTLSAEWLNQYYETRAGVPGAIGPFASLTQRLDRTGWMTSPGLKFDNHDGVRASTFYAYSFARLDSYRAAFGAPTRSEIDAQEFTNQLELDLNRFVTLTLGYTYYATAFDRENRTTGAELPGSPNWESHSPWARLELASRDRDAKLGAGVRYQWFDAFAEAVTGEVTGSYCIRESDTLLSAKIATAYAAPAAANYQTTPLNELKPEESLSWELGARQRLPAKVSPTEVGVVWFENRMDNLISSRNVSTSGGFDFRAFNALEARSRGLELFGETRPARQVLVFANATVQDARFTRDQPAFGVVAGDRLLRRPEFMATAGVELMPSESVTFGFSATAVTGREDFGHVDQEDYVVSRVYGDWRFAPNARLFARVENLFDKTYDPAGVGSPALPRAVYVGITVAF